MDSLDAECLLIQLAEGKGEIPPPDLWRHHRSGSLSWAYEGGERVFTWSAEQVAEMARRWRDSDTKQTPPRARLFVDAHKRLEALAGEAGLGPADVVIHDLRRSEIRALWEEEKVELVIEEIEEGAPSARRPPEMPPAARRKSQPPETPAAARRESQPRAAGGPRGARAA